MRKKSKIVYGLAGMLAFIPLIILIILQSLAALEANYDTKIIIDADNMSFSNVVAYDVYNNDITTLFNTLDENGKPILWSIVEVTNDSIILDIHGGKIEGIKTEVSGLQFVSSTNQRSTLGRGIIYIQFKNLASDSSDENYDRDKDWLLYIDTLKSMYTTYYEQPTGTVSYAWLKIISVSAGTLIGIFTVSLVILRKSTKALVKRYWRISVLVTLIEGSLILGLINWLVGDIFLVFVAVTIGWSLFIGTEKIAKLKGYLETTPASNESTSELVSAVTNDMANLLRKYRK